uniref:Uncharacterized protein LOC100178820 n=1 Tax=Phallusia mammillata TaxID=59560 RepID=A0A6F9DHM6_9ASCI|nr:uncharacterized protein LOC100178820 [Phallusia mammillata]
MKHLDISCIKLVAIVMLACADGGNTNTMRYSRILPPNQRSPYSSGGNHRRYFSTLQRSYIIHKGSSAKLHGSRGKASQSTSFDGNRQRPPMQTSTPAMPIARPPTALRVKGTNRFAARSLKSTLVSTLRRYEKTGNKTELIRRVERILTNLPGPQKSVNSLRRTFANHKLKSRAEFGRLWSGIHETKLGLNQIQTECVDLKKNITSTTTRLQQTTQQHENNLSNVQMMIKQIEKHQNIQDVRYFEVAERGTNNSRELYQIKEEIDQELRSIRLERDTMAQSLSHIQRRLQINFNEELNQHRSVLSQIEKTIVTHNDMLLNHDETIASRQVAVNWINHTIQGQKREMSDINIRVETLQREADSNIYRLLKQARSRLSTIAGIQSSVMRLNRSLQQTTFKENYLEAKLANIEEILQRLIDHLNSGKEVGPVPEANSTHAELRNLSHTTVKKNKNADHEVIPQTKTTNTKPIVLNHLKYVSTTARDVMEAIEETGFEDRLDRMSRSLRHHNEKLTNVSDTMKSVMEDIRSLSITTSNYFSIINEQANTIRKQNETIAVLLHKFSHRESVLASHLEYQHNTVMKLMSIVTSFAQQLRQPLQQHRDCHDLWMNGQFTNGVYSVIKNMEMKPVYCNMSDEGGWTIIQRRSDGTQDFNTDLHNYQVGFGSVFGEYWLGLENIRWLTHGRIYSLRIILEDWGGNQRHATYDQFMVYGQNYVLMVSGYRGNAGDAMMASNDVPFQARKQGRDRTITSNADCTTTRQSGWWFPTNCGEANPNGPYPADPRKPAKKERETNYLGELVEPTTQWMRWRRDDFPLKKVSMQIIPRDVLLESDFSTTLQDELQPEDTNPVHSIQSEEVDEEVPVYNARQVVHNTPQL